MKDMPQTVFVVDDDDAVRNSLRLLLKSAGVHAEVARLGAGVPVELRRLAARLPGARRAHARA